MQSYLRQEAMHKILAIVIQVLERDTSADSAMTNIRSCSPESVRKYTSEEIKSSRSCNHISVFVTSWSHWSNPCRACTLLTSTINNSQQNIYKALVVNGKKQMMITLIISYFRYQSGYSEPYQAEEHSSCCVLELWTVLLWTVPRSEQTSVPLVHCFCSY